MKGMKIGIDFGSSSLKIYAEGKGLVIDEPSVVAIDNTTGNPIAFGKAADKVDGRCNEDIVISKVIRNGIVSDFDMAERMLRFYLQRVCGNRIYKPNVIVSLPSNISNLEKKTFHDVVNLAGAGRVCMVDGILASALGCDISIDKNENRLMLDIGHHVTEYAIISSGKVLASGTIKHGSDKIDKIIINHLKRDRDILIGPHTAREIKNKIASANPRNCEVALFVSGKSHLDNMPISFEITSTEIFPYVNEQIDVLVNEIGNSISKESTRLLNELENFNVVICGGGALIFDIADRFTNILNVECCVVNEPRYARIRGLGKFVSNKELLDNYGYRFIFKDEISDRIKNKGVFNYEKNY